MAAGVATMAATTVATMAAVEGITAGDFVQEVSSLGMHPESIIPSNTNLLEEEQNQRTTDRRVKANIKGELQDLREDVREEVAYLLGMESWIYGYPLVLMDVTRQVLTAAPAPNSEGTAAPINQLAKMPHYVSSYFKNVVRISLNSLWTTGWLDLGKEPIVFSVPYTGDRYYVMSVMSM